MMSKAEIWVLAALAFVSGVTAFVGVYFGWLWLMMVGILLVPILYLPWSSRSDEGPKP